MAEVHLRPITVASYAACLALQVSPAQAGLVASNAQSLAQAAVDAALVPLAIYDAAARGHEQPLVPMVGFTMYDLREGVGFILRLMIDHAYQRRGYGRAAMLEVIRRLRLHPEAEMIATSHHRGNAAAARLYHGLGFIDWEIAWTAEHPDEVFLQLP